MFRDAEISFGETVMSLQDTLDRMKATFEAGRPQEILDIMHRATDDLRHSGIMDAVLKNGDEAPEFTLPDQTGAGVSSGDLLQKGPLVVSFYRGVW